MPLDVKITEKVADGFYKATGTLSVEGENKGVAEVLLQETQPGKVKLVLDSSKLISKIGGREVMLYTNVPEVEVKKVAPGSELSISKFWFNLKK